MDACRRARAGNGRIPGALIGHSGGSAAGLMESGRRRRQRLLESCEGTPARSSARRAARLPVLAPTEPGKAGGTWICAPPDILRCLRGGCGRAVSSSLGVGEPGRGEYGRGCQHTGTRSPVAVSNAGMALSPSPRKALGSPLSPAGPSRSPERAHPPAWPWGQGPVPMARGYEPASRVIHLAWDLDEQTEPGGLPHKRSQPRTHSEPTCSSQRGEDL